MKTFLSLLALISVLTFQISCDDTTGEGAGVSITESEADAYLAATDDMSTSTDLQGDDCGTEDALVVCATPAEYRLGITQLDTFGCGSGFTGVCELTEDGSSVASAIRQKTFTEASEGTTGLAVIAGGTIDENVVDPITYQPFSALKIYYTFVEYDFPDVEDIEESYRGATLRLCLIDDCIDGASRGDILIKLSGSETFSWFDITMASLSATRPDSPLTDSTIVAAEDGSEGAYTDANLIVPVALGETLSFVLGGAVTFTVKANVENTMTCEDSSENGVCEISNYEFPGIRLPVGYDATIVNDG